MCSRAGNPSVAKKPSFRRTLVGPSPEKGPGSRLLLQVDTTQNRRKAIISQTLRGSSFGKLRTVVMPQLDQMHIEFVSCHCGHMDVRDQTGGLVETAGCEKTGCRGESLDG